MKVELKLETVTPLFLGGANQQPELRPASVRGALRYWFRAALGGVIGDDDYALKELRRREAEVFGDTERGSAVVVRLAPPDPNFTPADEFLLPHRYQGPAKVVPADTEFDLILSLRPRANAKTLEMATWSALLFLSLGGLGRRSRRGAGSLRIKSWSSESARSFSQALNDCLTTATTTPADKHALATQIACLLDKTYAAFTTFAMIESPRFSTRLPSFSVLVPDTRVVVATPGVAELSNYNDVLFRLMDKMSRLKTDLGANFVDAFGSSENRRQGTQRRASPLHVKAYKLRSEWALVLTHLKAKIRGGEDGKPEIVEAFFDDLIRGGSTVLAHPRATQGENAT